MSRATPSGTPADYDALLAKLRDEETLDARERAAMEFAEGLAVNHAGMDDEFMGRMREVFNDAELVELGLTTGAFIMLGRLNRAFDIAPMAEGAHTALRVE